ncbi:MAG: hypothetical protein ACT443_13005 [Gemmatimonadota bacterium]
MKRTLIVLTVAMFLPSLLFSQTTDTTIHAVVKTAQEKGWFLRITTTEAQLQGGVRTDVDSSFAIGDQFVRHEDVLKIERRRTSHNLLAAGVAGGLGLLFGFLLTSDSDSPCNGCRIGAFALGGLGFVLGAIPGSSEHWIPIWSRSKR